MADEQPNNPGANLPTPTRPDGRDRRKKTNPQVIASFITAVASLIVAILTGVFALHTRPSDVVKEAKAETAELEAKVAVLKDAKQFPFVPPGTIMAYGGKPDSVALKSLGWLLCNGESFSPKEDDGKYTPLFNAIGFAWGRDETDNNRFRIPDLQGYFLRGVDPNDATNRFALHSGNTSMVGSYQTNSVGPHAHFTFKKTENRSKLEITRNQTPTAIGWGNGDSVYVIQGTNAPADVGLTSNGGGAETRPKNAYVYYIIKY